MQEPAAGAQRSSLLSGGFSNVHGDDDFDEDISVVGNRVVWSAAGIVRRRFTLESPDTSVLQACLPYAVLPPSSAFDVDTRLSCHMKRRASQKQTYISVCRKDLSGRAADMGNVSTVQP